MAFGVMTETERHVCHPTLTTLSDGDLVCLRHAASEQLRVASDQLQGIYTEQRRRLAADDETHNQENL